MLAHRYNQGFTLVELVVTLAVAAIIMAAAVPSFQSFIQNNRITAQVNEFITALNLARSEAIKRGTTVRVSAIAGGTASNEWGVGWQVWVDANGDGDLDAGEELRVVAALSGGATLDSIDNVSEIQYLSSGFLNLATGATRTFNLRIPNCTGNQGRNVTVIPIGRATIATAPCA